MISLLSGLLIAAMPISMPTVDLAAESPRAAEITQCAFLDDPEIPEDCTLVSQFGTACVIRCPDGLFLVYCAPEP